MIDDYVLQNTHKAVCFTSLGQLRYLNAFKLTLSKNFGDMLMSVENPHGNDRASQEIKNIIKKTDLVGILKKSFYDLSLAVK